MKTKNVMWHSPKSNSEEPNFERSVTNVETTFSLLIIRDNEVIKLHTHSKSQKKHCKLRSLILKYIKQWLNSLIEIFSDWQEK